MRLNKLQSLALGLVAIAAGGLQARAADRVTVSVYQSVSDAGVYIAKDRGYFKEQGISVDLIQLDSPSAVMTALASGQVDAAGGAPSAAIYNSARQGLGVKIVADKGSMPKGSGYICLVVRALLANAIKTPADLAGHTIAWSGYGAGTTNEPALDHLIKAAGLRESDIKVQNLSFGDSLTALASGAVDAAYLIEPLAHAAEEREIGKIMMTGDQIYPDQQVAALLYGPNFATKRADVARRFMVAYLKGVRDYDAAFRRNVNRPAIVAILAANTTVKKPETYQKMVMPGLDPDGAINVAGMKADMDWFLTKAYLKAPVDMNAVVDGSFAEFAVKKLGPAKR